jgi:hypothetical protein
MHDCFIVFVEYGSCLIESGILGNRGVDGGAVKVGDDKFQNGFSYDD